MYRKKQQQLHEFREHPQSNSTDIIEAPRRLAELRPQIRRSIDELFELGLQLQRELSPPTAERVSFLLAELEQMRVRERELEWAAEIARKVTPVSEP